MKIILNGQCFQVIIYWASIKALLTVLSSIMRLIVPFITILLTLLAAPEVHRLLEILGR